MQGEQVFILYINQTFNVGCPRAVIVTLDEVGPFLIEGNSWGEIWLGDGQLTLPGTHKRV